MPGTCGRVPAGGSTSLQAGKAAGPAPWAAREQDPGLNPTASPSQGPPGGRPDRSHLVAVPAPGFTQALVALTGGR